MLKDRQGLCITDPDERPARWLEHYTELYLGLNVSREELLALRSGPAKGSSITRAQLDALRERVDAHADRNGPEAEWWNSEGQRHLPCSTQVGAVLRKIGHSAVGPGGLHINAFKLALDVIGPAFTLLVYSVLIAVQFPMELNGGKTV